ncbi:MAG: AzlD domain-containing protein [Solirubrobacterales bacterium]|nr:AzlD domain-containing protein [Solirubrobacterales bacterium]
MSDIWLTVTLLAAFSIAIRASGPLALGGRSPRAEVVAVIELLAPALLAALVVVETVGGPEGLDPDARIAGVAAAGALLIWRRSAVLSAIAVAALVAAAVRALG